MKLFRQANADHPRPVHQGKASDDGSGRESKNQSDEGDNVKLAASFWNNLLKACKWCGRPMSNVAEIAPFGGGARASWITNFVMRHSSHHSTSMRSKMISKLKR